MARGPKRWWLRSGEVMASTNPRPALPLLLSSSISRGVRRANRVPVTVYSFGLRQACTTSSPSAAAEKVNDNAVQYILGTLC